MPISLITHLTDVRIVRGQSPLANQHPELFSRLQLDPAQQDQSSSSLTPSSGFSLSTSEHGSTSPECSTVVKSCKHCSFSFRIDDKQKDGLDYCSKDCRVCHTWFRSSSQTVQPGKINRTTSPRSAVERAIASNQLNTSEKIKQHYTEIKHHSDTSDCYKETWRVSNPKGEKIIISDSSPRALKNKKSVEKCEKNDSNNSSPLTTTAVSSDFVGVTRPLAQRPYLFY